VSDLVEFKTMQKVLAASASSTIESPSVKNLNQSHFASHVGCPVAEIQSLMVFKEEFIGWQSRLPHQRQQTTAALMRHMTHCTFCF